MCNCINKSAFKEEKWSDIESLRRKKEYLDNYYNNNLEMFLPFSIFVASTNKKDAKNVRICEGGKT